MLFNRVCSLVDENPPGGYLDRDLDVDMDLKWLRCEQNFGPKQIL